MKETSTYPLRLPRSLKKAVSRAVPPSRKR